MRRIFVKTSLTLIAIGTICLGNKSSADDAVKPATMPATTTAAAINWDQAAKHVGETVTVTGPVKGTHVSTGGKTLILNIGKDYPDPGRFSIMIATDAKNPAKADDYTGKTVTVTGKIVLYRNVPEIKADKAAELTIEKQ